MPFCERGRACIGSLHGHAIDVDEVTNSKVAYLRLHGRNEKAYITGKTVPRVSITTTARLKIAEVAQRSRETGEGST